MSVAEAVIAPGGRNEPVLPTTRQTIVLRGVPWHTYQSLRKVEENNHLRMTYDRGVLEVMSPFKSHGKIATILDRMIYEWTRFRRIEVESGRDMTCDREDLEQGLQPDLCYWIAHGSLVRGKDEIDFLVDPPPDLALEVDITRSSIPKLPIYESLKIPEVWRWQDRIEVLRLNHETRYEISVESTVLPGFPLKLAEELIQRRNVEGENALLEQFERAIANAGIR
jgi:Uma2 family endonuclease